MKERRKEKRIQAPSHDLKQKQKNSHPPELRREKKNGEEKKKWYISKIHQFRPP
jgi:hypothetical protein